MADNAAFELEKNVENVPTNRGAIEPKLKIMQMRDYICLTTICYAQFCIAACGSLQAPFFPKEAESKGASATVYGLVFGVFELSVIISSPIFGKLVTYVTPKFLVTSGVFMAGSCCVLFGFLDHAPFGAQFISLAFAVRIFEGLGCAAVFTISYTIIMAEFPQSIARAFSAIETFFGLGIIAGPTIGGFLYEAGGFLLPFLTMGSMLLLATVFCFFFIPERDVPEKTKTNMFKYLANVGVTLDAMAIISSLIFIGFNSATLEPHLRQFRLSPSTIGLIFVITGSTYAVTTPLWGCLVDKGASSSLLCILGYAFQCVNLLFVGPVSFIPVKPNLVMINAALAFGGFGMACKIVTAFIGALKDTARRGYPNTQATHGMVSAMFAMACSIGAFVGPSIGGYLLDTVGYRNGTTILLVVEVVLMSLTISYMACKKKPNSEQLLLLRHDSNSYSLVEKTNSN